MYLRAAMLVAVATVALGRVPYEGGAAMDPMANYYLQRLYRMAEPQTDSYLDQYLPSTLEEINGGNDDEAMNIDVRSSFWGSPDEEEEEEEEAGGAGDDNGDNMDLYSPQLFREAQARDEEHLEHSALQGTHQVSGGTLEGQPPQKQVKTDKPLPAYCNPPNPCPLGKTAEDNCVEKFENSMENNKRLLEAQDCPCDTEHMFSCPAGQQTVTSKGSGGQAALNKVMSELAQLHSAQGMGMDSNPYLTTGLKREKLVAKKSPGMNRRKRSLEEMQKMNPYHQGLKLKVAAKKSPPTYRMYQGFQKNP